MTHIGIGVFSELVIVTRRRNLMPVHNNFVMGDDFMLVFLIVSVADTGARGSGGEFGGPRYAITEFVDDSVMSFGLGAGNFLKTVAGDISAAIECHVADFNVAVSPEFLEAFRGVEIMIDTASMKFAVIGAIIEKDNVVVGTAEFFAVFATAEEAKAGASDLAKALEDVLVVRKMQSVARGQVFVVIGEGSEGRFATSWLRF